MRCLTKGIDWKHCVGARRNGDYDQRIDEASGYCVACIAAEAVRITVDTSCGSDLRERAAVLVASIFDNLEWAARIIEQAAQARREAPGRPVTEVVSVGTVEVVR
jgi:hypothetical protein